MPAMSRRDATAGLAGGGGDALATLGPVCVVGNLNIDLIIRGVPALPAWGQEAMGTGSTAATAGQAANVALGLAGLGVPVAVGSCVGEDELGQRIRDDLKRAGVGVDAVETVAGGTAVAVGIVREDGEWAFVSDFTPMRALDAAMLARHAAAIDAAAVVCLVGIFCLPGLDLGEMAGLLQRARRAGATTVLDTGWDPGNWGPATRAGMADLLAATDVFLPNLDEARALTGVADPLGAALALRVMGPGIVVVTCGPDGAVAVRGEERVTLPALPAEVVDAVGAGDCLDAGFLAGMRDGWTLARCLAFGSAAAALHVSRAIDRFPSRDAVLTAMAAGYPAIAGLASGEGDGR